MNDGSELGKGKTQDQGAGVAVPSPAGAGLSCITASKGNGKCIASAAPPPGRLPLFVRTLRSSSLHHVMLNGIERHSVAITVPQCSSPWRLVPIPLSP